MASGSFIALAWSPQPVRSRRAKHESGIILHQSAKRAFDGLGIKKLPTVKGLQDE